MEMSLYEEYLKKVSTCKDANKLLFQLVIEQPNTVLRDDNVYETMVELDFPCLDYTLRVQKLIVEKTDGLLMTVEAKYRAFFESIMDERIVEYGREFESILEATHFEA